MNIPYTIFLLTFLAFPIIGIILSYYIKVDTNSIRFKRSVIFFVIHNVLFLLGFSLKGDNIDYCIFSLEYFALCLTIFSMDKAINFRTKAINILGIVIISIGSIIGIVGILMFIPISQDYNADKIFNFESNDKTFQTRRYSFGFATLESTRYTFETYRDYQYLPFEMKIDKSNFLDSETKLDISEQELQISIIKLDNKDQILFQSANGQKFWKSLY